MKKILLLLSLALVFTSCYKNDINDLNDKYDQIKIEQERQAEQLRNYQTVLDALQKKLTVTSISSSSEGYKILFSDGTSVDMTHSNAPVYTIGANGNWLVDGVDSGIKAQGKDGATPQITIVEGFWYVDNVSTGIKAQAVDGQSSPVITSIVVQGSSMIFTFSDSTTISVPMGSSTAADYTNGFFLVNEGWYGHEQGSLSFYRNSSNSVETGLFTTINPGIDLGVTTQFGGIYNEKIYLVSKQGALVVVDAKTLKQTGRIENIDQVARDGRAFCGVNAELGLVSTLDGIYKLNLDPLSLGDKIEGISGQIGEMLQFRQYVFAVGAGKIYVINTTSWTIEKTFDNGRGGLVVSKDGMVWSANGSVLVKINPYTLEMETTTMPAGVSVAYNSFAWTASSLCASKTENALFFRNGLKAYKYVIGDLTSLNSPLFTVPTGRMVYGAGLSLNPQNNQVVVTTIGGYGVAAAKNNIYFYDGTTGSLKKSIYFEHYWFPAMILFPES